MLAAIVQARITSTRLPGKVLKEVMGRPLLWYLIERLKRIKKDHKIIIATSTHTQDNIIEDFCRESSIDCFRGKHEDVLDRYYQCALAYKADIIVRITADCPLIEPNIASNVIDSYLNDPSADLVLTGPNYPEGFDTSVFPFKSLEIAWKEAKLKSDREHVTTYIWKNDKRFKIRTLSLEKDYSFLRLTVDEAVDFEVLKAVIEELYEGKGVAFLFGDILKLYEEKPYIFEKNQHIIRNEGYFKSLREDYIIDRKQQDEKDDM